MRLILRHIRKSVLRTPLQSIIILLTVFFSALIFLCAPALLDSIPKENDLRNSVKYGESDLMISSGKDTHFVSADEIKGLLGSEHRVYGTLAVSLASENETALGVAADLATISECFDFSFISSEPISESELEKAIFVTKDYAQKNSLKVGDTVKLGLLGAENDYTVKGINSRRFFDTYDILMSDIGAKNTLAELSPLFVVFDTLPCSNVYIVSPNGDTEGTLTALAPYLNEHGLSYTQCKINTYDFLNKLLSVFVIGILLFSAIVAAVLLSFPLEILHKRREQEMQAFIIAGTPKKKILAALFTERAVYTLLGTALALAVSPPLLRFFASDFTTNGISLSAKDIIMCVCAEILINIILLARQGIARLCRKRMIFIFKIATLTLFAAVILTACLVKESMRYYFASPAIVLTVIMIFIAVKPLSAGISKIFGNLSFKLKGRIGTSLSLASKNNASLPEIHNVGRILSAMISISLVLITSVSFFDNRIDSAYEHFDCDNVVLSADMGVSEKAMTVQGTAACSRAFVGEGVLVDCEYSLVVSSVEDAEFSSTEGLPKGNEILISKPLADLYGYGIGDKVTMSIMNEPREFVLGGYCENNSYFAIISAEDCKIPYNITLVKKASSADQGYLKALTKALSVYGVPVQSAHSLLETQIFFAKSAASLIGKYVGMLLIMISIASLNLIWVCYRRRKKEFSDFKTVGMTTSDISLMIACELVLTLILTAVLAFAGSACLHVFLSLSMNSFGFTLFQ